MRGIGNLLTIVGFLLFVYTIAARFIGEKSIMGFTNFAFFNTGFSATGMFSGIACVLLLAVIAFLKAKE
jgi:hypothetical protein